MALQTDYHRQPLGAARPPTVIRKGPVGALRAEEDGENAMKLPAKPKVPSAMFRSPNSFIATLDAERLRHRQAFGPRQVRPGLFGEGKANQVRGGLKGSHYAKQHSLMHDRFWRSHNCKRGTLSISCVAKWKSNHSSGIRTSSGCTPFFTTKNASIWCWSTLREASCTRS
jgi:hypothetical protein